MSPFALVLGTRNVKKRDEIYGLLDLPQLELYTLDKFGDVAEVVEDGESFLENATKKAVELACALDKWVLGEDSGLVVDALDGAPGIYSARYAGQPSDDERNIDKLLTDLRGVEHPDRTAHYVCAAVVSDPSGDVRARAEGRCDGWIAHRRQGSGGFGYDPLFLLPEEGKTFGELPTAYKQAHSHRAAAMSLLRPQLLTILDENG